MPVMGMLSRICWVLMLLAAGLVLPAQADPRPFELRDGQVVIMVTINGQELPALLDTGATRSLIEVSLARELGIRVQRIRSGGTFGVSGERVAYGYTQHDVAIDFGEGPTSRRIGTYKAGNTFAAEGVRILIGMDFLRARVLSLDFETMTLNVQHSSTFKPPEDEPVAMTSSGWRRTTLPVDLGGVRANLLVDTAASGALHLDSTFVAAAPELNALPVSQIRITGIDGTREHEAITVPHVTLGRQKFENVRASSASLEHFERGKTDIDGVVGVDLLKRFNLVIDFGRYRIWMTPNNHADVRLPTLP
jgi:predicted aspartyl protease